LFLLSESKNHETYVIIIFAEKNAVKIGVFVQNAASFLQNLHHKENNQLFRRKWAKIAEKVINTLAHYFN
jgi:hypothetical protein